MMGTGWVTYPIIAPEVGPLRGLIETATANSVSALGTRAQYLQTALNIALNDAGLPRKRPARDDVSGFGTRTSPAWCGIGGGGLLYDADSTDLRQGSTSVYAGFTAANIASDVFTAPNGTVYLVVCDGSSTVKKITGTTDTDLTGFSALSISPTGVAAAGTRLFFSFGSFVYFSTTNPTGGTSGEWDAANFIQFVEPGMQTIKLLLEFGGYLYAFATGSVGQINPREPDPNFDVILSDFGVNGIRAACRGRDRIYFTDGQDVYQWIPGSNPQSIAVNENGEPLVRGTIRDATTAGNPYDVISYDSFNDLVYLSNDTNTLVYKPSLGAWVSWGFGADAWAHNGDDTYYTESGLTETLTMNWSAYSDTIAGAASTYTWTVRTANFKASRDAQIRLKNVEVTFPGDADLSDVTATINIIKNAQDNVATGSLPLVQIGAFEWDVDNWDGGDEWSGSGGLAGTKVGFQNPQGRTLAVEVTAASGTAAVIHSIYAQVREMRAMSAT